MQCVLGCKRVASNRLLNERRYLQQHARVGTRQTLACMHMRFSLAARTLLPRSVHQAAHTRTLGKQKNKKCQMKKQCVHRARCMSTLKQFLHPPTGPQCPRIPLPPNCEARSGRCRPRSWRAKAVLAILVTLTMLSILAILTGVEFESGVKASHRVLARRGL